MLGHQPLSAADALIELPGQRVVLIRRKNPPSGWAIPGGFIEYGETAEDAAIREALEETGLRVELDELFGVYSDPSRDPRHHTLTVVYLGRACGDPLGGDDAAEARPFTENTLPVDLAFDHSQILADYFHYRRTGERPRPRPLSRPPLSATDRAILLGLARDSIRAQLVGEALPEFEFSGALAEPRSAFVSLHLDGHLRGCIGTLTHDRPLHQVVQDMALAAAFRDPRFPPLGLNELSALEIQISVLSAPQPTPAQRVIPGLHGVSVAQGSHRAVYLPQVARDEGWSREMLLEQTCLKAGLDPDAWKHPETQIATFTAEIFDENVSARP